LRALTIGISLGLMKREERMPQSDVSAGLLKEKPLTETPVLGPVDTALPKEIGGRGGLDPTRFGDWEKNGRCIDF
jgi:hypothetical protein